MYVFTELEVSISKGVKFRRGGEREEVGGKGVFSRTFYTG